MASLVKSFAIDGIDGYQVDIETKTLDGQPSISVIGLGDQAVKEASERVQAAIDETGYAYCGANRPGLRSKTAAFRF